MNDAIPADILEQRAASQRQRLHQSVEELRSTMHQRLDVQRAARTYVWPLSAAAALVALALGYRIAGAFSD